MNRQIENKIAKEIIIEFTLKAALPLIIGSGEDEYSDMEIIKDNNDINGKPYIPGTAIAGVMRHYTKNEQVFNENRLSPIYTYDCEITDSPGFKISVRDGVRLNDNKVAEDKAKYDYEIIEAGAEFKVRLDLIIRDKNLEEASGYPHEKAIIECAKKFIWGIQKGEIYIGAKSKRGFGRVEIDGPIKVSDEKYFNQYDGKFEFTPVYDVLEVDLHLTGGIMIRKYNDKPGDADYIHLKSNGVPVIPGTTWNGAILHRTEDIFKSIGKYSKDFFEKVFGSKVEKDQGQSSLVIFEESIIEGGVDLPQTRVKIDRFTGGAVDSALFTEEPHYIGDTTLVIKYSRGEHYILGLLLPALEDLCQGYLAVGGETSIGRGIFQGKGIRLNGKALEDKDSYYRKILVEVDKYVE